MRISRFAILALLFGSALAWAPSTALGDDDGWKDAHRTFRAAQKSEVWTERRDAYVDLAYFDGAPAVKAILKAMGGEKNPAVILTAIQTLGGFASLEALAAVEKEVVSGRGMRRLYMLMAMARQKGAANTPVLLEVLQDKKDMMAVAQAALALGERKAAEAKEPLIALTKSKAWQLRAAAARALAQLGDKEAVEPLVKSLAASVGSERRTIAVALETLTGQKFGLDTSAWTKLAAGADPAAIKPREMKLPYFTQIPITGKRVVFIITNSQRNEDPHLFVAAGRLESLCEVPGARPILHTRIATVGNFIHAHAKRCIQDLPTKGKQKLGMIFFNQVVRPLWPKFVSMNSGTLKQALAALDGAVHAAGINHYDAMIAALDYAGPKDSAAWKNGPDEIIFTACNSPNAGEIKEAEVIAAAIALRARIRMVPIHTVGVTGHPYTMMEHIAASTGGLYKNLYE